MSEPEIVIDLTEPSAPGAAPRRRRTVQWIAIAVCLALAASAVAVREATLPAPPFVGGGDRIDPATRSIPETLARAGTMSATVHPDGTVAVAIEMVNTSDAPVIAYDPRVTVVPAIGVVQTGLVSGSAQGALQRPWSARLTLQPRAHAALVATFRVDCAAVAGGQPKTMTFGVLTGSVPAVVDLTPNVDLLDTSVWKPACTGRTAAATVAR
jgi:hypothetical protein